MKRDAQSGLQAKKFKTYHRLWVETSGQYHACEWLAAHVGHLVANVEKLQKQVRKIERKIKQGEQ